MNAMQNLKNFSMGTLALYLLMTLLAQRGEGTPVVSSCKIQKSELDRPYISTHILDLARCGILLDNDTNTRLMEQSLFRDIDADSCCYLVKEILGLSLEKMKTIEHTQCFENKREILPFLSGLKNKLDSCVVQENSRSAVERKIEEFKNKLAKVGEGAAIKVVSEIDFLVMDLRKHCS